MYLPLLDRVENEAYCFDRACVPTGKSICGTIMKKRTAWSSAGAFCLCCRFASAVDLLR